MINEKEENKSKYNVEFLGEKYPQNFLTYKVIVLGSYGVRKTSIIFRLMNKEVDTDYAPTISADIKNFQVKVNDKIKQIQIWDTCGSDDFVLNTPNLFKNTFIIILVFAINDEKSFKDLEKWYNILKEYTYDNTIFLIGNKSDLREERKVESEKAEGFKNSYDNIKMFFETSAKNGENMDKLLENIAISIYEKDDIENEMKDKISIVLNKKNHKKRKKKRIC